MNLHLSRILKLYLCGAFTAVVLMSSSAVRAQDVTEQSEEVISEDVLSEVETADVIEDSVVSSPEDLSSEDENMTLEEAAVEEETAVVVEEESPQEPAIPESPINTLVRLEIAEDLDAPYRQRRDTHGVYFGVNYQALVLANYTSALDSATYDDIFGIEQIPLVNVLIEYKLNTFLGAFSIGIDFGSGSLTSSKSGFETTLAVSKYGGGLKYTLDTLMNEPYLAPYVGVNIWKMDLNEEAIASGVSESFSETTDFGYNYTAGVLFQLDWLEENTSRETNFNWGLQNTFLDIYATQYAQTSSEEDPNTETDILLGAGLRLEF